MALSVTERIFDKLPQEWDAVNNINKFAIVEAVKLINQSYRIIEDKWKHLHFVWQKFLTSASVTMVILML